MPRIDFLQQWFSLNDSARVEALHKIPTYRSFDRASRGITRLRDKDQLMY